MDDVDEEYARKARGIKGCSAGLRMGAHCHAVDICSNGVVATSRDRQVCYTVAADSFSAALGHRKWLK